MSGHGRRARLWRFAVAASLVAIAGLTPVPALAAAGDATGIDFTFPTGFTVSGTITDASHAGVGGIGVGICTDDPLNCGGSVETASDGSFTIHGVLAGTYYAMAIGESERNFLNTFFDGATGTTEPANATSFVVAGNVAGIDVELANGFTVSGTVTDGSSPVANVEIAINGNANGGIGSTDSSGNYTVGGLAPGFYQMSARPPVDSPFMFGAVSGGTVIEDCCGGDQFEVTGDVTGRDVTLVSGNTLSGNISGLVRPAQVVAIGSDTGYPYAVQPNGDFSIPALWPDQLVQLLVTEDDTNSSFDEQFPVGVYNGTATLTIDQSAATNIDMSGGDVTGIDAAAPSTPTVTGHITGDDGLDVHGWVTLCGNGGCASSSIGAGGAYGFVNLPDDSYQMFVVAFEHVTGHATATSVSANASDAVPVVVSGSNVVLDLVDPAGFSISGHISGPVGEPVEGAQVGISRSDWGFIGGASTDASGNYTVHGLPAGDFYVGASPKEGSDYVGFQYWTSTGGTPDSNLAELVTVPSGATLVIDTNPADGDTGVARTIAPTVVFSGDVTGVNGTTITLHAAGSARAVAATVTYDAGTHTATLKPRGRLRPLTTYVLGVNGVLGVGSTPVPPVLIQFTTRR